LLLVLPVLPVPDPVDPVPALPALPVLPLPDDDEVEPDAPELADVLSIRPVTWTC